MSFLQDPIKALDQAEWYLSKTENEVFPGAFEIAAGNLCRQVLEQILFILCFFSEMPASCYLRRDKTLQTAGRLSKALDQINPKEGKNYWECARKRGPRIRKFARYPRSLKKWQREFNEPSHFSPGYRRVGVSAIRDFVNGVRGWFDDKDKYLIIAAINELYSDGKIRAILGSDEDNTPGVSQRITVTAANIHRTGDGGLTLDGPFDSFVVIPDDEVPRGPWPGKLVLVQHSVGIMMQFQFVTKCGNPVDLSSFEGILKSFSKTRGQRAYLVRRLRQLGFEAQIVVR